MMNRQKRLLVAVVVVLPLVVGLIMLGWLLRSRPSAAVSLAAASPESASPLQEQAAELPKYEPLPTLAAQAPRPQAVDASPEFEKMYAQVSLRFEQAARHPLDRVVNLMQYECYSALREVRLLALSSPKEMHAKSVSIIRNPSADPAERDLAISALGILAKSGYKDSESELYILAKSDSALSVWPDPINKQLMTELKGEEKPPGSQFMAKAVLERFDILSSSTWQAKLREIVESTQQGIPETLWAIRAADIRKMPDLLDAMRVRLDQAEGAARGTLGQFQANALEQGQDRPKFDDLFVRSATVQGLWDDSFDEVLVAFNERGGKLTPLEKARLEAFGYLGSPRKQLEELLSGQK